MAVVRKLTPFLILLLPNMSITLNCFHSPNKRMLLTECCSWIGLEDKVGVSLVLLHELVKPLV